MLKKIFDKIMPGRRIDNPQQTRPSKITFTVKKVVKGVTRASNNGKNPKSYLLSESEYRFKKVDYKDEKVQNFKIPVELLNIKNKKLKKFYIWKFKNTGIIYTAKSFDSNFKFFTVLRNKLGPLSDFSHGNNLVQLNNIIEAQDHRNIRDTEDYEVFEFSNFLIFSTEIRNSLRKIFIFNSRNKKLLKTIEINFFKYGVNQATQLTNELHERIKNWGLRPSGKFEILVRDDGTSAILRYYNQIFCSNHEVVVKKVDIKLRNFEVSRTDFRFTLKNVYQIYFLGNPRSDLFVVYRSKEGKDSAFDIEFLLKNSKDLDTVLDKITFGPCYEKEFEKNGETKFFVYEFWRKRATIFGIDEASLGFKVEFQAKVKQGFGLNSLAVAAQSLHVAYKDGVIVLETRANDGKSKLRFFEIEY